MENAVAAYAFASVPAASGTGASVCVLADGENTRVSEDPDRKRLAFIHSASARSGHLGCMRPTCGPSSSYRVTHWVTLGLRQCPASGNATREPSALDYKHRMNGVSIPGYCNPANHFDARTDQCSPEVAFLFIAFGPGEKKLSMPLEVSAAALALLIEGLQDASSSKTDEVL